MSPKSVSTTTILRAVSDQSLGFSFGAPQRPNDAALACLLPILRETSRQRQYVTYAETDRLLVSDSGVINRLNVKNTGRDNIFVRSGTIFEGKGTQSRALTRSAVIFPGSDAAVDVRCVHASHGIRSGSSFTYSGVTPLSMDANFYQSGYRPGDQSSMWQNVQSYTATTASYTASATSSAPRPRAAARQRLLHRPPVGNVADRRRPRTMGIHDADVYTTLDDALSASASAAAPAVTVTGNDDLRTHFDQFATSFDSMLSKARLIDHQTGIALITHDGCQTVELFDVPVSWEALHKDAVKRMGTELLRGPDTTSVFEYKPERAVAAVQHVLSLPYRLESIWEHKPSNGEPHVEIYGLTAMPYVGEAVEIGGELAHLTILRTAA